jgi:pimeloyl-ACP methyl ester carboxylesterase
MSSPKEATPAERIKYRRKPYLVVSQEKSTRKDVYGSVGDNIVRQAQLLRGDAESDTVIVAMHPIGSPAYLPLFSELARTGLHVIGCGNRYPIGDFALQMENVLLDLGACVRDAKQRLGYRNVILAGWSGGGSPMMGYQAEAEKPVITQTAAGEDTLLADTELMPADGVMQLAAPRSRHRLLTDFLDASITNELQPDIGRDVQFDLYDPANPNQAPYSPDYVVAYRQRQRDRNARITEFALENLDALRAKGRPDAEHSFVVHGTMADPRFLDATIEPNGRRPGWSYLGDPEIANTSPGALMRFTTTRSWLSQWSLEKAQVDAADAAPRVTVPVFILVNGADDAVPTSHPRQVFDAVAHDNKELLELPDANHYFNGEDQRSHLSAAADRVHDWMARHAFV